MAPGRHFLATIRLDLANDLSSGKSHPWPSVGMGFGEPYPDRRPVSPQYLFVNNYKIISYGLSSCHETRVVLDRIPRCYAHDEKLLK